MAPRLKVVPAPLTGVQSELASATEALAATTSDLKAAQAALARLDAPSQLLAEARARLDGLTGQHCAALQDWYAGGAEGSRPR
jgi:hypothetical protein